MLSFEYKEASAEKKKELLQEIISLYNMADKAQAVQALAHCQAVYETSTQDEFAEIAGVSARTLRDWKNKEYPELYAEAFEKYTPTPELLDVEVTMDEDVLEQVYQNMLSKLSDKKTSAKDLSLLLQYLNISSAELKQYAKYRGSTLRSYVKDNEALLIKDEAELNLTKAFLSESDYLYMGSERTQGATEAFLQMDFEDNLVRLELMTAGMLMYSLWNGTIHPSFVEMAETLRVLKMASGEELDTKQAVKDFDSMDGRVPPKKPFKLTEKDIVDIFGADEGKEIYQFLTSTKKAVDKKTAIKLPEYETTVKADYEKHLKLFPSNEAKTLEVLLAELDADADKEYREKYKQYLNNQEEN
jgi:hypothetical protein